MPVWPGAQGSFLAPQVLHTWAEQASPAAMAARTWAPQARTRATRLPIPAESWRSQELQSYWAAAGTTIPIHEGARTPVTATTTIILILDTAIIPPTFTIAPIATTIITTADQEALKLSKAAAEGTAAIHPTMVEGMAGTEVADTEGMATDLTAVTASLAVSFHD